MLKGHILVSDIFLVLKMGVKSFASPYSTYEYIYLYMKGHVIIVSLHKKIFYFILIYREDVMKLTVTNETIYILGNSQSIF